MFRVPASGLDDARKANVFQATMSRNAQSQPPEQPRQQKKEECGKCERLWVEEEEKIGQFEEAQANRALWRGVEVSPTTGSATHADILQRHPLSLILSTRDT